METLRAPLAVAPIIAALLALPPVSGCFGQNLAAAASPCLPAAGIGCFFIPAGLEQKGAGIPLTVYFRGHRLWNQHPAHEPKGCRGLHGFDPSCRVVSAQQAFATYGLEKSASAAGTALLVTGDSELSVTPEDIKKLSGALRANFGPISLALHSGGEAGFMNALPSWQSEPLRRVVFLDSFWYTADTRPIAQAMAALEKSYGTTCAGFASEDTYSAVFLGALEGFHGECAIDVLPAGRHNDGVNQCLGGYLAPEIQACR